MSDPRIWLIYSREHNAWWRANAQGYTNHIEAAGRYTKADAEAYARVRDWDDKDSPPEVICIAPEAGEINADLLEALKGMMEGMEEPNERGVWGCRVIPSHAACSRAARAIARAEDSTPDTGECRD